MTGSARRWRKAASLVRRAARTVAESEVGQRVADQVEATRTAYEEGRHGAESARESAARRRRGKARAGRPDPQLAEWYANLEVPYGSDLETVARAWKRLMARYHPDRHADDAERDRQATELAQALNRAYEGLRRHLE